jgi:hypothetical protein
MVFILMFTVDINLVFPHSKLLASAFLFLILETFLCLLLVLRGKVVALLDVDQPQVPCAEMLKCLINICYC